MKKKIPVDSICLVIVQKLSTSSNSSCPRAETQDPTSEKKLIKDLYCGFSHDAITIFEMILIRPQLNKWICEKKNFFYQ